MGSGTDAQTRSGLLDRVAGAPVCWGVCEVPGWGYQLDPDTVFSQMTELGIGATEYGPDGFLPDLPADKAATLAGYGLKAVGQFVPVVLHDSAHDPLPEVDAAMTGLVAADATIVVIAAATGVDGYDSRPDLDDEQWATLLANLDRISDAAAERGLVATIHPHVGTMVESGDETARVLAGSRILLCLDTGHLLIGGGDPVTVAEEHPDRIGHMHLKDVRRALAEQVQSGALSYTEAVRAGMYVPLGAGDVDISAIVTSLEAADYDGWYVLEQDTVLDPPSASEATSADTSASVLDTTDPVLDTTGPVRDVRASLAHLREIADRVEGGRR